MRRPPRPLARPHRNAALRASLSAGCALALAAGCASTSPPPAAPDLPPPAAGELRVRLAFGAAADLDLYVTDPLQETVYFANTPSRFTGGRLDDDRRCAAPPPRIETVTFEQAPPGRYRVGVDHARACGRAREAAFRVIVEGPGLREEAHGEVSLGTFLPRVLEVRLEEAER
jgi:hypothetical protein